LFRSRRRTAADRRALEGDDHEHAAGMAAPERCAVQRERRVDRALRSLCSAKRRRVADGDRHRRGSALPHSAVRHQLTLQARDGSLRMEPRAVRYEMMNGLLKWALAPAIGVLALALPAGAQQSASGAQRAAPFGEIELEVWPVRGNVYMIVGAGGNTTVQVGSDGVLIVDTKLASAGEKLLEVIRELAGERPIRYVINTHIHADHIGGNAIIAPAGSTIAGGNVSGAIADAGVGAAVLAHENVLLELSAQESPPPFEAWPTVTFFMPQKDLYFNGEAVQILHKPAAHTNGDSIVFFRRSDVISAGDIFSTTLY